MIGMAACLMPAFADQSTAPPLKVFILAGQSNMEGPANIKTFDYMGDDPKTAPMLKEMLGPDGEPVVCDRAWLSYLTGDPNFEVTGKMTAGYNQRNQWFPFSFLGSRRPARVSSCRSPVSTTGSPCGNRS